jgi:hypothetical protein
MTKPTTRFLRAILAGGLLFISGHAATALAVTKTVCPSGCDYTTITDGLYNLGPNDTVVVGTPGRTTPETYYENITMLNGVNLVSQGDDTTTAYTDTLGGTGYSTTVLKRATLTVIHGAGTSPVVTFPYNTLNNAFLDGFTIENVSEEAEAYTGLMLIGGSSPIIKNNIIRNNRGSQGYNGGIMMRGLESQIAPSIEHNVIHYTNGPGVGINSNANPTIVQNEIFTTPPSVPYYAPGIGLTGAASATILNNKLFNNGRAGIGSTIFGAESGLTETGIPIVIQGNIIHDNPAPNQATYADGAGVRITSIGPWSQTSTPQLVIGGPNPGEGNQFSRNKAGVYLDHVGAEVDERMNHVVIENNDFQNNQIAVRAEKMDSLTIKNNDMYNQLLYCAIRAENIHVVNIEGNEIHDNTRCGARIWNSTFSNPVLDIRNNNIYNSGFGGLVLEDAGSHGTISGNHIYQNGLGGILIVSAMSLDIINNEIDHNLRGGIHTGGLPPSSPAFFSGALGSAVLTIRGNKVHHNGQGTMGGGLDVRHASGRIENNLIYKNSMGGIRYGDKVRAIIHNTVVANGRSGKGAGIAYDDPTINPDDPINRDPKGSPTKPVAQIENNILSLNVKAGINAGTLWSGGATCPDHVGFRQYNLYYKNNGVTSAACTLAPPPYVSRPQLALCNPNTGEWFCSPGFRDEANDDYRLLATSKAVDAGDPAFPNDIIPPGMGTSRVDIGAYGGPNAITW